jgi:hypothetical protein
MAIAAMATHLSWLEFMPKTSFQGKCPRKRPCRASPFWQYITKREEKAKIFGRALFLGAADLGLPAGGRGAKPRWLFLP